MNDVPPTHGSSGPYPRGMNSATVSPTARATTEHRRPSLAAGLWLALLGTPPLVLLGGLAASADSEVGTWLGELGPMGAEVAIGIGLLFSQRWRRFGAGVLIGVPLGFVALALFMAGTLGG